jgi:hypothetical protein
MTPEQAVVGHNVHGDDDRGYFYQGGDVEACPTCGLVIDVEWMNATFVPRRTRAEMSHTYDGVTIVGEKLADLIRDWPGVQLDPLPAAPLFFRLSSTQVVEVDLEEHSPTRTHWCETCGRFKYIATGGNRSLKRGTIVPDGLVRTDITYGSAFDHPKNRMLQHPLLIVNRHFWSLIDRAGLGIRSDDVEADVVLEANLSPPAELIPPAIRSNANELLATQRTVPATLANINEAIDPDRIHTAEPATGLSSTDVPSLQLRELLSTTNGLTLDLDADGEPIQLRVHNHTEVASETQFLQQILTENRASDPGHLDELQSGSPVDLVQWQEGLFVFATVEGDADVFVLDTLQRASGAEPEVLRLDHSLYFASVIDEHAVINRWDDLLEFLNDLIENPAQLGPV